MLLNSEIVREVLLSPDGEHLQLASVDHRVRYPSTVESPVMGRALAKEYLGIERNDCVKLGSDLLGVVLVALRILDRISRE